MLLAVPEKYASTEPSGHSDKVSTGHALQKQSAVAKAKESQATTVLVTLP